MRFAWVTDIHLNFLDFQDREDFYQAMSVDKNDGILLTGDIAEATLLKQLLLEMSEIVKKPIYFILGNHDYYKSDVVRVRQEITALTSANQFLFWLPASGPQLLDEHTVLLGQDGWADGRHGDYWQSTVVLNDSRMITDLFQESIVSRNALLNKMQALADNDVASLEQDMRCPFGQHKIKRMIILTHIPPYKEACLYQGKISDNAFLPFFSCKSMGDMLLDQAKKNKEVMFEVLCGHTHEEAFYQPLENLTVKVGGAEYYKPKIQEHIKI